MWRWFTVSKLQDPKTTGGDRNKFLSNFLVWLLQPRKGITPKGITYTSSITTSTVIVGQLLWKWSRVVQCQPNAAHCLFRAQWRGSSFHKDSSLSLQSYLVRQSVLHLPFLFYFNELVSVLLLLFRFTLRQWWMHWKGRGADQNQVPRQCFFLLHCVFVVRQSSNSIMI